MKQLLALAAFAITFLTLTGLCLATETDSAAPVFQTIPSIDTVARPLEDGLSRDQLLNLLVKMGYLYAGFIVALIAIEVTEPRDESEVETS